METLSGWIGDSLKLRFTGNDQPINIHLTGCPHSCAQHYMGDIGLLGAKVKSAGDTVEGYLRHRRDDETFQQFTTRHDLNALQAIFSNEA